MQRLIEHLKEKHPDLSNRQIKRALEKGLCKVNGKIERFASRKIDPQSDKIVYEDIRFEAMPELVISEDRIIFEDDDILIYNKDGGYPALATKSQTRAHLHGELMRFVYLRQELTKIDSKSNPDDIENLKQEISKKPLSEIKNKVFVEPAHRLDKDTSGLMLFAKNRQTLDKLFAMFREKEISKEYEAIVDGVFKSKGNKDIKGTIDYPLKLKNKGVGWQRWIGIKLIDANSKTQEQRTKLRNQGLEFKSKIPHIAKSAVTDYQVIKSYDKEKYSHVKLSPKTGRMHQIRVHMLSIGHPIIGDSFYANSFQSKVFASRHLLHASKLKFKHPNTGLEIKVFAPLDEDMQKLLIFN